MPLALSAISKAGGIQLASTVVATKIPTVTAAGSTASPATFQDTLTQTLRGAPLPNGDLGASVAVASAAQTAQATAPSAAAEGGALYDDQVRAAGNAMWNALAGRLAQGENTATAYQAVTGEKPGAAELNMAPGAYAAQKLNQVEGSPDLGHIDVAGGYAGDRARAQVAYLLKVGPEGYVGVNSGRRDDREYYSVLEGAQKAAAEPTGVPIRYNPNTAAAPLSASISSTGAPGQASAQAQVKATSTASVHATRTAAHHVAKAVHHVAAHHHSTTAHHVVKKRTSTASTTGA
jgi:hypothetical protein